jgi:hypothetical protein
MLKNRLVVEHVQIGGTRTAPRYAITNVNIINLQVTRKIMSRVRVAAEGFRIDRI